MNFIDRYVITLSFYDVSTYLTPHPAFVDDYHWLVVTIASMVMATIWHLIAKRSPI